MTRSLDQHPRLAAPSHGRRRHLLGRTALVGAGTLALAVASVVMATPALAASASISVSPTSAAAGSPVTVSGGGWLPYDSVTVSLGAGFLSAPLCILTADSTGTIEPQSCQVPTTLPDGSYAVGAVDPSKTPASGGSFAVQPAIVLIGANGQRTADADVDQSVGLSGSGFAALTSVSATFGATKIDLSSSSTSDIGWLSATFTVPAGTAPGPVVVTVTDSAKDTAASSLDVFAATITAPSAGVSGQPISFTGSGWPGNDSITLQLESTSPTIVCVITADSTGVIANQSCTVPTTLASGSYTVSATDNSISIPDVGSFDLQPGITLLGRPTARADGGQMVGVSGSGFVADQFLSASFGSPTDTLTLSGTTSTGSDGWFTGAWFIVPDVDSEVGRFVVTISAGEQDSATFTLDVFEATITGPASGAAGHPVTLTGSGWPGNDSVSVSLVYPTGTTQVCSVETGSTGTLAPRSCTVPTTLADGSYTLSATDNSILAVGADAFDVLPGVEVIGEDGEPTARVDPRQVVGLSGNGFAADQTVIATVGTKALTLAPAPTTSSQGSFSSPWYSQAGTTFTVPAVKKVGPVTVTVSDADGDSATFRLDVYEATIAASLGEGVSGQQVSFTGSGWPGNDAVTVRLLSGADVTTVCTVSADSTGTITSQSCEVPTTVPEGPYTLNATDGSIAADGAVAFTVKPGITIYGAGGEPTADAAVGQAVGVSGTGFAAGSYLSATFGTTPVGLSPAPTTTEQGSFYGATLSVQPVTAPGPVVVSVTDGDKHKATVTLDVFKATIDASSAEAASGHPVTFSGSGWPAGDNVSVSLIEGTTTTEVCNVSSDSTGAIAPRSCDVPTNLAAGSYVLNATDNSISVNDTAKFTVQPSITLLGPPPEPHPTAEAAVGQVVGVSGTGFSPGTYLSATFGSSPVDLTPAPTISSEGSFSGTTFTVPPVSTPGTVVVTVEDSGKDVATYHLYVFDATISTSATSGAAGHPVTISGSGWPGSDTVSVRLVSDETPTPMCNVTTSSTGTIASQTCALPTDLPARHYTVDATDTYVEASQSTAFELQPEVLLSDSSGGPPVGAAAPGSTVYLSGWGFAADSNITSVSLSTSPATPLPTTPSLITTTSTGTFASLPNQFVLPSAVVPGTYEVSVEDASDNSATVQLIVA